MKDLFQAHDLLSLREAPTAEPRRKERPDEVALGGTEFLDGKTLPGTRNGMPILTLGIVEVEPDLLLLCWRKRIPERHGRRRHIGGHLGLVLRPAHRAIWRFHRTVRQSGDR